MRYQLRMRSVSVYVWRDMNPCGGTSSHYLLHQIGEMRPLQACRVVVAIAIVLQGYEGRPHLQHGIFKRMLPDNQSCDPSGGTCSKGDFVDKTTEVRFDVV